MNIKKVTQKDRYGNQTSIEYEMPEKPLDPTRLMEKQMELNTPDAVIESTMMAVPPVMGEEFNMGDPMSHPGEPRGEDTVPAWLTPGEFVVNAEAAEMYGPEIEAMNNHGREVQQFKKGGSVWDRIWGDFKGYKPYSERYKNEGGFMYRHGVPMFGDGIYNQSYEDPIMLNEIKRKMAERKQMFQDAGYNIEHEYMDPKQYAKKYGSPVNHHSYSPGEWHARYWDKQGKVDPTVNIPATPSLANYLVGEEEYSHLLGAWDDTRDYIPEHDQRLFEEMRAKQEAVRNVGGYLSDDVTQAFDKTLDSYYGGNVYDRKKAGVGPMSGNDFWKMFREAGYTPGRSGYFNPDSGLYDADEGAQYADTYSHPQRDKSSWRDAELAQLAAMGLNEGGDVPMPIAPPWRQGQEEMVGQLDPLLHEREGFKDYVYTDHLGKPTTGAGHLLTPDELAMVGLEAEMEPNKHFEDMKPFSEEQLHKMFEMDRDAAVNAAIKNVGRETWSSLSPEKKKVLASMAFQLGEKGQSKFKKLLAAVQAGDDREVARQALTGSKGGKSLWLKQTPKRALDLAEVFHPDTAAQYRNAGGQVFDEDMYAMYRANGGPIEAYYDEKTGEYVFGKGLHGPGSGMGRQEEPVVRPDALDLPPAVTRSGEVPELHMPNEIIPEEDSFRQQTPEELAELEQIGRDRTRMSQMHGGAQDIDPEMMAQIEAMNAADAAAAQEDLEEEDFAETGAYEGFGDDEDWLDPTTTAEKKTTPRDESRAKYGWDESIILDNKGRPQKVNPNRIKEGTLESLAQKYADGKITKKQYDNQVAEYNRAKAQDDAYNQWAADQEMTETQAADQKKADEVADLNSRIEEAEAAGDVALAEALRKKRDGIGAEKTDKKDDAAIVDSLVEKYGQSGEGDGDNSSPDPDTPGPSASTQQVEDAGKQAPPEAVEEGESFLKGLFGDLLDSNELKRMAIMYAGSRLLGYGHDGSIRWAAKNYVQRVDAKTANRHQTANEFAKSGKYTPASVANYKKSGDLNDLIAAGASYTTTGNTMQRSQGGKMVSFQEVKDSSGNIMYRTPSGQVLSAAQVENYSMPYEPAFDKGTPEYRERRNRARTNSQARFEEVWKAEDRFRVGENEWKTTTKIKPKQAADEFWSWSESMGLDPESDEALQIMTNAYQQAINDGKTGDVTPTSLKPYLENQYIREKTQAPELFIVGETKPGETPKYVRGDKMQQLNRNVEAVAVRLPGLAGLAPQDASSRVYDNAVAEWNKLDDQQKKLYNDSAEEGESGFYYYINKRMADLIQKL